jgi:hypothetical protein
VGDVVTELRAFAANVASLCHDSTPEISGGSKCPVSSRSGISHASSAHTPISLGQAEQPV